MRPPLLQGTRLAAVADRDAMESHTRTRSDDPGTVRDPRLTARRWSDAYVGRPDPVRWAGSGRPRASPCRSRGESRATRRVVWEVRGAYDRRAVDQSPLGTDPALTQRMVGAKRHPAGTAPVRRRISGAPTNRRAHLVPAGVATPRWPATPTRTRRTPGAL